MALEWACPGHCGPGVAGLDSTRVDVVLTKPGGSRPWQGDPVGRMCVLGEPAVRRGLGGSQVWVVVCAHQRAGVSDSPEWRTIMGLSTLHIQVLGLNLSSDPDSATEKLCDLA